MKTLRTGISAAYWCDPKQDYAFKEALLPAMTRTSGATQTSWFDELFEGGIRIPDKGSGAAMTLLITGPPGTGKSTLALEFCYRLAIADPLPDRLRSLYFTTEGHAPWLIEHAREFGWDREQKVFGDSASSPVCVRSLMTEQDFATYLPRVRDPGETFTSDQPDSMVKILQNMHKAFFGTRETPQSGAEPQTNRRIDYSQFDLVVFDNFNTIDLDKGLWFQLLAELGRLGPRLLVVVLDAPHLGESAKPWEYLADTVISMDRAKPSGYLIRTIEIIKSRYQRSALGRHQVKVQEAYPPEARDKEEKWVLLRHHPFRSEGGIFIYPSMHFVLSRHKYLHPSPDFEPTPTPRGLEGIKPLLGGGFRPGRCAALIGPGGTHKSRLAFVHLLDLLLNNPAASGIVISLGEEEKSTIDLLRTYHREQLSAHDLAATDHREHDDELIVNRLVDSGRLEVAYYPPGFITPEEFLHRLQLSIARQRAQSKHDAPLLVVFNSLNLLQSHFPLCADHAVFIPAVVELLGHEGVTSLFVTATRGQSVHDYGLLSLADPILEFTRTEKTRAVYFDHILPVGVARDRMSDVGDHVPVVQMTVGRFAGGTSAGQHVYLVLAPTGSPASMELGRAGLHAFAWR